MELEGLVGDLLKTERSGLKPLQRMSGIATMTQKLTNKIREQGYDTMVAATRKTDWQLLDKKAVCLGGGLTHRLSLHESILIKDNHLEELKRQGFTKNYIEEALDRAWKYKDEAVFIEIEVTTKQEAIRAAKKFRELQRNLKNQRPCVIMFDNMASDEIKDTIEELKKRGLYNYVLFEASGGIKEDNILEYAKTGCDVVSLGALTHSSKALDISQEIILEGRSACLRRSRK